MININILIITIIFTAFITYLILGQIALRKKRKEIEKEIKDEEVEKVEDYKGYFKDRTLDQIIITSSSLLIQVATKSYFSPTESQKKLFHEVSKELTLKYMESIKK